MANLSEKAYSLREKYKSLYGKYPRGWCHGEEKMTEYEEYLENIINESEKLKVYDLKDHLEFIEEVAKLEYYEWAENPKYNEETRIKNKIEKIKKQFNSKNFCKLILIREGKLLGFISIFPQDCDELPDLTPWYATMYVVQEEREKGYSNILNKAILDKAKELNIENIYLKTTLDNYYEKFGAKFVKQQGKEKIYKFILKSIGD